MAGIFKAYDIRGIYNEVLNKSMGYKVGLAFAKLIGAGKRIAVGRDGRPHSVELQLAYMDGLRKGGCDVVDMGLSTTPMTYYACFSDHYDGSTMVTASHNPGEYNGLKFCRENAIPVGYVDGLDKMEAWIKADQLVEAETKGSLTSKDYRQAYLAFLTEAFEISRSFDFAVDCGNGMGGYLIEALLEKMGQQAIPLYWDLDFSFPNHLANPLDFSNLADLQDKVRSSALNFGVAFDGDADRCFFVDDRGDVVPADILTALIASHKLKHLGPGAIVYDVRSSQVVREEIERLGGRPILCRVGHSFMKARLRKEQGHFGGELAGHFYFKEFAYADSAFYTMMTIMEIIEEAGKPLSELVAPFKIYHPSGEINYVTRQADQLIEEAPARFPGGEILTIDGIRIDFEDWWFCLRKSNTEPLLRLVVEAKSAQRLKRSVDALDRWISASGAVRH